MSESAIKPAEISGVVPGSIAEEVGFSAGDRLVAINGQPLRDLIDYRFFCAEEFLTLEVLDDRNRPHSIEIEKDFDEDLGLEFASALFDGLIQCNNRCPFCFIDQQPPGKRASLYLKDDDYRLSFLYGSYLTLTNLSSQEWERIDRLRLSPLFVSVHATNPEVRRRLLQNDRAGKILENLAWFQAHRLQIHAQVVLCPGINDGAELERTIRDLVSFHSGDIPAVASVAVVPVGLTKFRPPSANPLVPVSMEDAQQVIKQIEALQTEFRQAYDSTFVWLADEWYLIAEQELPSSESYEDYPQLGNGVGSIRRFIDEFTAEIADCQPPAQSVTYTWVVGNAVAQAFQPIADRLNQFAGLQINLVPIASDYWGQTMTVTGLITGQDLVKNLQKLTLGDGILIPSVMLKHDEAKFLDDMTLTELEQRLGVPALPVADIADFLAIVGINTHSTDDNWG
jgi:putative radical SAM enzyme (TIGR03279 family)